MSKEELAQRLTLALSRTKTPEEVRKVVTHLMNMRLMQTDAARLAFWNEFNKSEVK